MKKVKIKYFVSLLIVLLCSSCHDWLDINQDPNNPAEMDYEMVLPSGISSVAYVMGGRYQVLGALWSQHWTQSPGASQYAGIDSYDINSSSFDDNQFGELYTGALKALEYVRSESAKEQEWNYYLIATVMQAYTFQVLADLYDEIPFSGALSGEAGNLTPQYEKGQDIYDSLVVRIQNALLKDLDNDELKKPGNTDIMFGGSMNSWRQFANTLLLKLFLRQSEVRPDVARAGISLLFEQKAEFLSVNAVCSFFSNQAGKRNPLYETEIIAFGGNPNLVLSRTLHTFLTFNDDIYRLDSMFNIPQAGSSHKSLKQGDYNAPGEPAGINSASYSKPVFQPNAPVYLMSFTESCFLQAEAMIRYNVGNYTEAKEKYNDGLTSAFLRVLYRNAPFDSEPNALIESYINGPYRFPSEGSPVETFVKAIMVQKWVSLAGIQSLETFFERNRTHYPAATTLNPDEDEYFEEHAGEFTVSANNVTSGRFPKRLIFPESEISGNPNTPPVKPVWEKIWWDVKSGIAE